MKLYYKLKINDSWTFVSVATMLAEKLACECRTCRKDKPDEVISHEF